jgi:hypothetical protein
MAVETAHQEKTTLPISPTLAEFFNVPYHTQLDENDVTLALWHYMMNNNLIIDNRVIILDKMLMPIIHPPFCYRGEYNPHLESSIVMYFVARMHLDPVFIQQDIDYRLESLSKKLAARRILHFYRKWRQEHGAMGKPNKKLIVKHDKIDEQLDEKFYHDDSEYNDYSMGTNWCSYLAHKLNHNDE